MNHYGTVTILELLTLNGEAFCRLSCVIGQMLILLENGVIPHDGMAGSLGELHRETERLKLRLCAAQLERIKEHITKGGATASTIAPMVKDLYIRMLDELKDRVFVAIPSEASEYYDQKTPIFGDAVADMFPAAAYDISEAGKCFALGRYTACAFHLMRVFELGIYKIGDKLNVTLAPSDGWLNHLENKIAPAIEALPDNTPDLKKIKKELQQVKSHLHGIRQGWRNDTAHPKQTYTEEEAKALLHLTHSFMRHLASVL